MTTILESFLIHIHSDTFCVYWLFYLGYIFIAGWMGFNNLSAGNKISGVLLLLGAAALFIGIFYAPFSAIPFIWLVPVTVISLFRKQDQQFYNLLYCSLIPVLLLAMNKTYGII
ncbi:hypothetical protein HHL16_12995 [Pseudoflavitalea sp. G-6-1-2]|uniref:hypothetical protein n=1 Tax=Pseudoflavitalea sp. G-6-1-2 TaxID=2728841 RepID=UPI00146AFA72|nr:hypothetical protein [Pseudoflavitalea sp. G-6-1-2]NML21800.1 hypothetical protein [Pseudoflavitalea sp. G-6-1-2]